MHKQTNYEKIIGFGIGIVFGCDGASAGAGGVGIKSGC